MTKRSMRKNSVDTTWTRGAWKRTVLLLYKHEEREQNSVEIQEQDMDHTARQMIVEASAKLASALQTSSSNNIKQLE